jgi:hypothetical protein
MEEMLAPADPQGLPVGYDDVVVIFRRETHDQVALRSFAH